MDSRNRSTRTRLPVALDARCAAVGAVTLAVLLLAARAEARWATDGCHGPRLLVAPTVPERWRDAVEKARVLLDGKSDLDRCAELVLEADGDTLLIRIVLADGRNATRQLEEPAVLYETLEALLSVPPPGERWSVENGDELRPGPESRAAAPTKPSFEPRVELGLGVMGRVAGAPLYGGAGLAAFAQLSLDRWLLGVAARWDASDALLADASPSGFNMQTLALGINVGIRSSFRGLTVDALLGPEVRVENQEASGGETAPDGIGGGTSDVRLDAALRLTTPRGGRIRFFIEGDINASPSRLAKSHRLDPGLPTLPAWSAGLTLGVEWSSP